MSQEAHGQAALCIVPVVYPLFKDMREGLAARAERNDFRLVALEGILVVALRGSYWEHGLGSLLFFWVFFKRIDCLA